MFYKQLNGNKNEKQLQLSVPIIQTPVAIFVFLASPSASNLKSREDRLSSENESLN